VAVDRRAETIEGHHHPLVLANFLPFRLARAAQAVSALMAVTWNERVGLSMPAWRCLCVLAESGALDRESLADRAALSETEAVEAAAALLARGLIGRAFPPALSLPAAGSALHLELCELALAAEDALLAGLSPAEVQSLSRLLGRLQGAALRLAAPVPR
jgi:DNA-binding MarR family transcriptional regulator